MFQLNKKNKGLKNLKPGGTPGGYKFTDEDRAKAVRVRREKAAIRQSGALEFLSSLPLKKGSISTLEELETLTETENLNLPVGVLMSAQIIKQALSGDIKAYEKFVELTGQDPKFKIQEEDENSDDGFIEALSGSAMEDWSND